MRGAVGRSLMRMARTRSHEDSKAKSVPRAYMRASQATGICHAETAKRAAAKMPARREPEALAVHRYTRAMLSAAQNIEKDRKESSDEPSTVLHSERSI